MSYMHGMSLFMTRSFSFIASLKIFSSIGHNSQNNVILRHMSLKEHVHVYTH